jgi:CRP-like cAMP-binding protein
MPIDFHKLSRLITSRDVSPEDAQLIAKPWEERHLRMGEMLWEQGSAAPELGLLHEGRLAVEVDGEELGFVLPGDVVGETSALWAKAKRSASLQATEASSVLLLPSRELERLAQAFPFFQERLLDRCLEAQSKRIRAIDLRIARLSQGVLPAPSDKAEGGLAKLWRLLRRAAAEGSAPALMPLLRDQPVLCNQSDQVLEALARAFEPLRFDRGELLAKEAEHGDSVFLLAEGRVQALRHVRQRMAEVLVTFEAGWMFGAVTMAVPGPRTATCQAESAGWVYRMSADAARALPERARLAWKECLVATLGIQLRNANAMLAGFQSGDHAGGPLPEHELQRLLRAAGALLGGPGERDWC